MTWTEGPVIECSPFLKAALPLWRAALAKADPLWMYAIQAGEGGPVKLGVTVSPRTRIATLQTANAAELIGLAAWRILPCEEKQIHEEFAHAHIRGEWFEPTPGLVDFVLRFGGDFEDWTL